MGAWGTAIFSDDDALDIKREYQTLLAFGVPNEEALKLTKNFFEVSEDDTVFWLTVATIQQKYGILLPEVKERTLDIIESGADLEIWAEECDSKEGKKNYEKRKQVLEKLKISLLAEPLQQRRVQKPDIQKHRWNVGDVVAGQIVYKTDINEWYYNKYVLFRVVSIRKTSPSNIVPDLAYDEWADGLIYDWIGDILPNHAKLKEFDFCKLPNIGKNHPSFLTDTLYWIPKNLKFSLFYADEKFKLPDDFEYSHDNVLSLVSRYGQHFKDIYEKYKEVV